MIWRAGNITRCSAIVTRRIYQRRLCSRLLTSVRSLGVIVTWGTICLLAIPAQEQEIPSGDFSAVAIVANRWLLKQIRPRDATSRSAVDGEIFFLKSLPSTLHSKYAAWESTAGDSRPGASVDERLVYPLLQVSYGAWRLPIILYLPPLRGSDARRFKRLDSEFSSGDEWLDRHYRPNC
jgi:hypothetical protein